MKEVGIHKVLAYTGEERGIAFFNMWRADSMSRLALDHNNESKCTLADCNELSRANAKGPNQPD